MKKKHVKRGEREIEIVDEKQSHWNNPTDNMLTTVFSVALQTRAEYY